MPIPLGERSTPAVTGSATEIEVRIDVSKHVAHRDLRDVELLHRFMARSTGTLALRGEDQRDQPRVLCRYDLVGGREGRLVVRTPVPWSPDGPAIAVASNTPVEPPGVGAVGELQLRLVAAYRSDIGSRPVPDDELEDYVRVRLTSAGFAASSIEAAPRRWWASAVGARRFPATDVVAHGQVVNKQFVLAYLSGIGRGRAFGFGLPIFRCT
jgi:hypothetical protein